MGFEPHDLRVIAPRPSSSRVVLRVRQAALPKLALGKTPLAKTPCPWRFGFANPTSLARRSHNPTKEKTAQGAPAIKQAVHGRCWGRRHGRLILPCRFSVFICLVCAFALFCAACYRYDTFAHADTDFRVSAILCFCGIRYPFTRMFLPAVSPA